jgi:hypothetical protein
MQSEGTDSTMALTHGGERDANAALSASGRVLVSITGGLHSGATIASRLGRELAIGSAAPCDLVLLDDGVPPKAVVLLERDGGLVADVKCDSVRHAGRVLARGNHAFEEPAVLLRVGDAELRIELLQPARSASTRARMVSQAPPRAAVLPHRRAWVAVAGAVLAIAGTLVVAGGVVNASSRAALTTSQSLDRLIDAFNAQGAQIVIAERSGGVPVLRGLVADDPMRERLEREVLAARLQVEFQLHDVRRMGESLDRLALLAGHACEARHVAEGRFECDAGVAAPEVVQRLRALAQQVPGVVAFDVRAQAPEAAKPPEPMVVQTPTVESPSAPWPQIRHVALGTNGSFAIDAQGRTLRVGDDVDGARVLRIRFDEVDFSRSGQRHTAALMATDALAVALAPGNRPDRVKR